MTGAFLADIGAGSPAMGNTAKQGGVFLADSAAESFKGVLGGILAAAQTAAQQTVFTEDPIAADVPEEKIDTSLMSSKSVTDAAISPAAERALKYLSGSILEDVMGKPDGYFTTSFFDLFKYKTQLDLNISKEKADEDAGGVTDLWTTLLDSLNGTEVTEMSMFSANLGDALFGSERDYSKSSASVLSDLFDSLSTRNKTDLLKASGTDFADIAAMALMASGNMADIAGLIDKAAENSGENDMTEADSELSMLIGAADDETVEALAEKLEELVEQAQSKLAEDVPVPAENEKETDIRAQTSADVPSAVPVFEEPAVQEESADNGQIFVDSVTAVPQSEKTADMTENAAGTETVPDYAAEAVTLAAAGITENIGEKKDAARDITFEKAAAFGMKNVTAGQTAAAEADTADFPDSSLKDLYLSMRSFSKTSAGDTETPFVFGSNTGIYAENAEIGANEAKTDETLSQTVKNPAHEKEDFRLPAEDGDDDMPPEFIAPDDKLPFAAESVGEEGTEELSSVPEDRYNTIEQVLSRIEENNFSGSGTRELVVKLTPETLGEITVRIAKDAAGVVEITLAAQSRDVSELISSRASELAQSLADKGTAVSSVNVVDPAQAGQNMAFDMNGGQNAFNFRQQDLGDHYGVSRRFAADDEEDEAVAAVSAADSSDNNIFVSKEAKLWQKI